MQSEFGEVLSQIRTKESNYVDSLKVEASNKLANGWKSTSSFEILKHFSIVNGFLPDIMHDFLKGTLILVF